MTGPVDLRMNVANALEIANFLRQCDQQFVPPLSSRVEIADYSSKIALSGERFEAWSGPSLVGLVAAYCNDAGRREAFIMSRQTPG